MSFDQPLKDARAEFERAYLRYQLHAGSSRAAVSVVGLERTYFYKKCQRLGVSLPYLSRA